MDVTADELAGVVDLFGALTREELAEALAELAFKHGEGYEPDQFGGDIDAARARFQLVGVDDHALGAITDSVLVVGPTAFPELPPDARDLLHILDIDERSVDPETATAAAVEAYRRDAATATAGGETGRIEELLDVSYDIEAWADVDLADTRERLDDAL
ncbi:MAG: hypothetical protein V5A55_05990 [Halovenus sp.]